MAVCHFHGDRPGIGLCVRCRQVICAACCTRLDGINHCHACLKALAAAAEPPRAEAGARWLTAGLLLTLGYAALLFLSWLGQGVLERLDH